MISPLLLILGLALAGGGFALSDRHIAGLVVWLLLAALLALGAAGRATLGRPFYWSAGLILALALLSAFSSLWSGSIELSVTEADRVLVYLGIFLAAFLIAQTGRRRERFGEGIAIALVLFAALALASRLLPHVFDIAEGPGSGQPRLSYPLGYWNAVGLMSALAAALALWMSRNAISSRLRWAAVGLMPTALLALYFTYSRGGLLALVISCGCLIVLSHDRLWLLGTLAAAAVGTVPAVVAAQASHSLGENLNDSSIVGEGLLVLGLLVLGSLLALALFVGLRRLEKRSGRLTGQAVTMSRNPRLLRGLALAAVVLGIGIAVAVGGRAWHQFTQSDVKFPSNPAQHFGQLTGAGRSEFWRVAADAFEEEPVLGHGAGTYRFSWHLLRHDSAPNIDAHSLYLQAFAELGIVGGLLVLAMVISILWIGFRAWQAARGRRRELYAALLGVSLAFAVGVGIDWFWQIAAVTSVFFLAGGVLVAARCAQLLSARSAANGKAEQRRYGLAIAGLALAWIAALALVGPLLVNRELTASDSAVAAGNLADATGHAETARSIEPWATSPYLQLGLLAEREGNYPKAIERLDQAIEREEESWLLYYIRARVNHEAGNAAAAQADLQEAQRLNPEEACLDNGFEGCG